MAAFFSVAARKAVASLIIPSTTIGCSIVIASKVKESSRGVTLCDEDVRNNEDTTISMESRLAGKRGVILRKRMTPIGRFSLKSETPSNPSVPTFFMALSGEATTTTPNTTNSNTNNQQPTISSSSSKQQSGVTVPEFQSTWIHRGMPNLHPRFHSTVSKHDDRYFESKPTTPPTTTKKGSEPRSSSGLSPADMSRFTSETLHTAVYRGDLKKRIETLLMTPIDVYDKLWEVQISSGTLGSSGAIGMKRVRDIIQESDEATTDEQQQPQQKQHNPPTTTKLIESLLLFRVHHSLGDGVSLTAALGDLLDEAQEIRDMIQEEIRKRRAKGKDSFLLVKLFRLVQKLAWFLFGSIRALVHQAYLMMTTSNNPFLEVLNRTDSNGLEVGRSATWCEFATVAEVKLVAKAMGPNVTLNDLFVSCVTAAVARQLAEHRQKSIAPDDNEPTKNAPSSSNKLLTNINVVIPAHLAGGILPPGREVGNLIGAFVARVPGEMTDNASASDRLSQVHSSLLKWRRSPAPFVSYYIARTASSWLPSKWATRLMLSGNANAAVVVSNNRGLTKKVHINGRPVESMVGFIPLPPGLPVGVVIQSYDSVVSLSVNAEKWAVPDADKFLGWILDEYKLLCKEASIKQRQKEITNKS